MNPLTLMNPLSMIGGLGSSFLKGKDTLNNLQYELGMSNVTAKMQQDSLKKAQTDAENARVNGLADSSTKAASAAVQNKINF